MKQLSEQEVLHKCAVYCSLSERCAQDIRKKMEKWEIPIPTQQMILSKLQQEGFLDESRYCSFFVNDKTKLSKWGKNKIIHALRSKGIADEIIQESIKKINPEQNEEILKQLLQTKMKSIKGKNDYEVYLKLLRFAAGRGFDSESINKCLKQLKFNHTYEP